ncbi:DUF2865 domain-containing protein [Chelatococcus sp. SYSU_G07232]|uniref:DUF2865 domain-containing protein n=1 Tax=Chelatococcus albus TaxID=3047466 RepID=A0ABT7AKE1_9HYPH|nr:DUF2865 domain-containing protein [Chelatococcus sp. SYSU_G07232]MDJ1159843.1 DUF2865 domain-containing protein [Chelatococcus sp. SYSU_G07232]
MAARSAPTFIASALMLLTGTVVAVAQSPMCERYRAELASIERNAPDPRARQYEQAAQRQRAELNQTMAQYQRMGCDRGRFLFFGDAPPPECGSLRARISQMQANLDQLLRQADQFGGGPGVEIRRRQLLAAIDQACRPGGDRAPGFFERLFGTEPSRPDGPLDNVPPIIDEQQQARGGGRAVCVRACDGYFFPLPTGSRENGQEMCQALCPGAQTSLYFMPTTGVIEQAVSASGQPYTSLPNASRYEKAYDQSCSCRAAGQSWAEALQNAEAMLGSRKSDIIVTPEKAEELSRPRTAAEAQRKAKDARTAKGKPLPGDDLEAESPAEAASALPTGGQESAGIGPQDIRDDKTLTQREGLTQEVTTADGAKRKVRIVAPNVIAVPQMQQQTKTQ